MNPLTVTWSPHLYTEIGWKNFQSLIHTGDLANVLGTPSGKTHRKLTKLSFEILGDPFQPFIYGQANFPLQTAVNYDIPLIMYGENGEVEYGGDMKNAYKPTRDYKADHKKHYFSGLSPDNKLPEIIELKNHPWFIGVQFHPEFKSRPLAPHPLFSSFIKAAKNHK